MPVGSGLLVTDAKPPASKREVCGDRAGLGHLPSVAQPSHLVIPGTDSCSLTLKITYFLESPKQLKNKKGYGGDDVWHRKAVK